MDAQQSDRAGGEPAQQQNPELRSRLMRFVRRHPAMSAVGAVGIGLLGGIELAAGIAIGAGAMAILDRPGNAHLRDRARALLDRAPEGLRERVRAVMQAARGKQSVAPPPAQATVTTDADIVGPASA
jgi:hypothetical protein